jgi:hypothetical protein
VENPGFRGLDSGGRWATTFVWSESGQDAVYKPGVIPLQLTEQRENSFPEAHFIHSSGKAGKTGIQTTNSVVN